MDVSVHVSRTSAERQCLLCTHLQTEKTWDIRHQAQNPPDQSNAKRATHINVLLIIGTKKDGHTDR